MSDSEAMNLYLRGQTRTALESESNGHSVSKSAYIDAFMRLMNYPITMRTPGREIVQQFRALLREEIERRERDSR